MAFDPVAFSGAVQAAVQAFKVNAPLPSQDSGAHQSLVQTLETVQPYVKTIDDLIKKHPGAIRAACIVLNELDRQGQVWAKDASNVIEAVPSSLASVEKVLPKAIMGLKMFGPVPTWQPGPRVER